MRACMSVEEGQCSGALSMAVAISRDGCCLEGERGCRLRAIPFEAPFSCLIRLSRPIR